MNRMLVKYAITEYQSPAAFCRQFEWTNVIMWNDLSGWLDLSNSLVVNIRLAILEHADDYDGFSVDIISKTGRIAREWFVFSDYGIEAFAYYSPAWGLQWRNGSAPTDTKRLVTAIERLITIFGQI